MKAIAKGIDISAHNGVVDWKAVKASGVDYVILRAGLSNAGGGITLDVRFEANMKGAQAAGLGIGVYLYARDRTPENAQASADRLAKILAPYKLDYPVYYDQEDSELLKLTKQQRTDIAKAFLERMQAHGFYVGLYSYTSWLNNHLDMSQLKNFDVWVAQYADHCTYGGSYGMWQHTVIGTQGTKGKHYWTSGTQAGVQTNCDLNVCYKYYPAIIKGAGLNGYSTATQPEEPTDWQKAYEDVKNRYDALCAKIVALGESTKQQ